MANIRRESIPVADQSLSVLVRAGDPTLVLLHGLAGHGGEWSPCIEHLDLTFGLVAPDLRGHGASYVEGAAAMTVESAVADVVACIEHADAPAVTLVGQSMGGLVAMLVAAARPELVNQLVLVDAGVSVLDDEGLERLAAWFDTWHDPFANADVARDFFGRDAASTPQWVAGLERTEQGLRQRFDSDAMVATMKNLSLGPTWELWESLQVPVTIMRATDGVLDENEASQMAERHPNAELITVFSGHDIHLDEPELVASMLGRIAQGVGSAES